jgi:hypothetical protein
MEGVHPESPGFRVTAPDVTAGDALREAESVDLTPGVVWTESQLVVLRDLLSGTFRKQRALIAARDELRATVGDLAERYERELALVYDSPYKQAAIARSVPAALHRALDAASRPRSDAQGVTGVSGSTRDDETVGDE